MSVFLTVLWTVVIIAAVVVPVVMLIWLFKHFVNMSKGVSASLGKMAAAAEGSEESAALSPLRGPGPLRRPEDLAAARQMRRDVAKVRQIRKQKRYDNATSRWQDLGLI